MAMFRCGKPGQALESLSYRGGVRGAIRTIRKAVQQHTQSKTLARSIRRLELPPGFGLRRVLRRFDGYTWSPCSWASATMASYSDGTAAGGRLVSQSVALDPERSEGSIAWVHAGSK